MCEGQKLYQTGDNGRGFAESCGKPRRAGGIIEKPLYFRIFPAVSS
jgi:hypothetical protein